MEPNYIENYTEAIAFIDGFNFSEFSFDTETYNPKTRKLTPNFYELVPFGLSLCNDEASCYIDVDSFGTAEDKENFWEFFKDRLELNAEIVVAQNIPFDVKALSKVGIDLTPKWYKWFDVMVAHHLLDENAQHGLKDMAVQVLGVPEEEVRKINGVVKKYGINHREFYKYGQLDAVWTWQLYKLFKPQLTQQGLDNLFYKLEMPFLRTIVEMESTGIRLDIPRLKETKVRIEAELLELETLMLNSIEYPYTLQTNLSDLSLTPVHDLNFNSNKQMREIVFDKLGLEPVEFTDTDLPSLNAASLKVLKDKHEFVEYLNLYRTYKKILGTFIEKFLNERDGDDRIRSSFWDTGTVTGRLSSSDPNLQQLPNPKCLKCGNGYVVDGKCVITEEDGETFGCGYDKVPDVRACFVASKGKKMIAADFSQQETVIMGHLSDDDNLIEALRMGQDFHLLNANAVFNLGVKDEHMVKGHPEYKRIKTKFQEQRRKGKAFSFKLPYGAQKWAISKDLDCSLEEAQEFLDTYFSKFPGLKKAIDRAHKQVDEQGYVTNLLGRRRRFTKQKRQLPWGDWVEEYDDGAYRQSFNFLIQSLGTELIRKSCVLIQEYARRNPEYGIKILATIHDELIAECNEEYAEEVSEIIVKLMKKTSNFKVPLKAEANYGKNYSEVK